MFHKTVIGTAAYNLDTYLMSNDAVNYLLNKNSGDIAVIEGVMGFYDGFSFTEKGSTHELSEITDTDVILVVNCRGMSLSAKDLRSLGKIILKVLYLIICPRKCTVIWRRNVEKSA